MEYDISMEDPLFFTQNQDYFDFSEKYSAYLPNDWHEVSNDSEWINQYPVGHITERQGWKVHISSEYIQSHQVLNIVSKICHKWRITFKYLKTEKVFTLRNGKNVDRSYSGKFITCYPSPNNLKKFLDDLENALQHFSGPYILTDKRWKKGPIYLRYGVFRASTFPEESTLKNDELLINGKVIKDLREPRFIVPKGLAIPDFLKIWLKQSDEATDDKFPFIVNEAIKFSNCGGIYEARLLDTGERMILRESRPYTGLDFSGEYSIERLEAEKKALYILDDIDGIPKILWSGQLWEHSYLGEQKMEGVPLNNWLTENYPLYSSYGKQKYLKSIKKILEQLINLISVAHSRGVYHQDIHFGNILVDQKNNVSLIDWEQSRFFNDKKVEQKMAAPGYGIWQNDLPSQIDWYGVKQIAHYLYYPLLEQSALVFGYEKQTLNVAHNKFIELNYSMNEISDIENLIMGLDDKFENSKNFTENKILKPFLNRIEIESYKDIQKFIRQLQNGIILSATEWQKRPYPRRDFPVHYYGLNMNQGIAFSDLGILWSIKVASELIEDSYEVLNENQICFKIQNSIRNFEKASPGLFDGISGSIWLIDKLGKNDLAVTLYDEYYVSMLENTKEYNLYSGKPGILLVGLYLSSKYKDVKFKNKIIEEISKLADMYVKNSEEFSQLNVPISQSNDPYENTSGLLYGHAGIGWLFGEAYRYAGDKKYADCLNLAIKNELKSYKDDGEGGLQFQQINRLIPYLATGSSGLALLIKKNKTIIDSKILDYLHLLENASNSQFCVFPGLFNGLCGLHLTNSLYSNKENKFDKIKLLIEQLESYIISVEDSLVVAGDSGLKVTTDVASGASGIILSIASIKNNNLELLPSIQYKS